MSYIPQKKVHTMRKDEKIIGGAATALLLVFGLSHIAIEVNDDHAKDEFEQQAANSFKQACTAAQKAFNGEIIYNDVLNYCQIDMTIADNKPLSYRQKTNDIMATFSLTASASQGYPSTAPERDFYRTDGKNYRLRIYQAQHS
jgi:hypothetical protein